MFADKQAVLNAFRFRHACKSYDAAKKIPADDFAYILETARLSPSSFGLESWHFLMVQNRTLREELRDIAWGAAEKIMDCSHFVILLARTLPCRRIIKKKSGAARMECRLKLLK